MFRSDFPRVSTASVRVCGLRATTQVISVVIGRPCASTVATTQVLPPSRNCTRRVGMSAGAVMGFSLDRPARTRQRNTSLLAGLDAGGSEMRAEDRACLIAFRSVELSGDQREERLGASSVTAFAESA